MQAMLHTAQLITVLSVNIPLMDALLLWPHFSACKLKCLTLLRKPLRIDAAFTDNDLGILMGFSRITGRKKIQLPLGWT